MRPRVPTVKLGPRYKVVDELATGGMGVVLLALRREAGGARPVAIKQLHAQLVDDAEVVTSFVDEARIASRIVHPNVVHVHDVEMIGNELVIVMEYVEGIPLRDLIKRHGGKIPVPLVRRILVDALNGLAAAHALCDEHGKPLGVVHRDVSPHNLLVGANGVTRVADFGIAMAVGRIAATRPDGGVKGKLQYLSPEQVFRRGVDGRTDVFAAGVVAWEALVGRKLFDGATDSDTIAMIIRDPISPPSMHRFDVPLDLDETILHAIEREPDRRFASALEFARALEDGGPLASREEVGRIVIAEIGEVLAARRQRLTNAASEPQAFVALEGANEEPTAPAASRTPSQTFLIPQSRGRSVSPIALLVVGSVCVSGGLIAGFSVRGTSQPRVAPATTFSPMPPVEAPTRSAEATSSTAVMPTSIPAPRPSSATSPGATTRYAAPAKTTPMRRAYGGAQRTDAGNPAPFIPDDL